MFVIFAKILLPKNVLGLTLFPFIILKNKNDKYNLTLMNHEKIHLRQQLELFILPFYMMYVVSFVVKYLKYRDANRAYLNIIFEREAYGNEKNLEYLKTRKWFAFLDS